MIVKCLFVFFGLLHGFTEGQQACQPPLGEPSCVCETPDGAIDLTSLSSHDGSPRFTGVPQDGSSQFLFSYNPCTGFSEGDPSYTCYYQSVSVCQTVSNDQGGTDYYSLGDPTTETMHIDSDTNDNYMEYDNGDDNRLSKVYLICDPSADTPLLTAEGDAATPLEYVFRLTTKCACPGGCGDNPIPPTGGPHEGHIAPGIIGIVLILVLPIGFSTYLIAGAVILHKKYEKQGLDMIPQIELWRALPFLVKDGCVFTFGPLINYIKMKTGRGRSGLDEYETIK